MCFYDTQFVGNGILLQQLLLDVFEEKELALSDSKRREVCRCKINHEDIVISQEGENVRMHKYLSVKHECGRGV